MKIKLKKGLNLNIAGGLGANPTVTGYNPSVCAIVPDDFPGFKPKVAAKEGEAVSAGAPLLYDKDHPEVKLVAPLCGTVRAVVRGERRKILRVEVEASNAADNSTVKLKAVDSSVEAKKLLAESGMLAFMRRRPYDIVPDPADEVRDIFVTALDTAPLAPSPECFNALFSKEDYEAGVALLAKVTSGKVYVCYGAGYTNGALRGAEMVEVTGPHPAGNVGVQIANISPVNKGDVVWTLDLPTLGRIGKLALTGSVDFTTFVAITGPEVENPVIVRTLIGAPVAPLLEGRLKDPKRHLRVICGNVLTGTACPKDDSFIHFPYRQITVIDEGDDVDEFMGWASFNPSKMSVRRSFPGAFRAKPFSPDARLNGGRRSLIMSGEYEEVIPMDILPEYLLKAIMSHNIEDMEKLGIYEVAPEDFALAEYVDTSKLPLQQIVRDGLDYLRKELE